MTMKTYCIDLGNYFDLPDDHKWQGVEVELSTDVGTEVGVSWSGCRSNTRECTFLEVTGDKIWVLGSADDIDLDVLLALGKEFLVKPWTDIEDMLQDFTEQLDD